MKKGSSTSRESSEIRTGERKLKEGVYYFTPPNRHGQWIWVETSPGATWETDDEAERYFQQRGYPTMRVTIREGGT
jgi:hypothetical protein